MTDISRIRAALELLRKPNPAGTDKRSWVSGMPHWRRGDDERFCISGALGHVHGTRLAGQNADRLAIVAAADTLFPRCGYGSPSWVHVEIFNDAPGRKFTEIEQVLEKAAVRREEDGAQSI